MLLQDMPPDAAICRHAMREIRHTRRLRCFHAPTRRRKSFAICCRMPLSLPAYFDDAAVYILRDAAMFAATLLLLAAFLRVEMLFSVYARAMLRRILRCYDAMLDAHAVRHCRHAARLPPLSPPLTLCCTSC